MENDLRGTENYFELTGGSSYRGFELPEVDCNLNKHAYANSVITKGLNMVPNRLIKTAL